MQAMSSVTASIGTYGVAGVPCKWLTLDQVNTDNVGVEILNHCIKPPKKGRDLSWEA